MFSDVHCGRIQCQGGRERPLLGTNAEILTTTVRFNVSDLICRGTFFHLGDDVSDPATVAQGTACGLGKVRQCPLAGLDEIRQQEIELNLTLLSHSLTSRDVKLMII